MAFELASGIQPVTSGPLSAAAGVYQASTPTLQKWLQRHQHVADLLGLLDVQVSSFATRAANSYESTQVTLETKRNAEADIARLHHAAREAGVAVDQQAHTRLLRTKEHRAAAHERASTNAALASSDAVGTREATNQAVRLATTWANADARIVPAETIVLPKGSPAEIVKAQRVIISELVAAEKAARAAPIPQADAIAASVTELDALASRGSKVIWPMEPLAVTPVPGLSDHIVDVKVLLADVLREQMVARIERIFAAYYATLPPALDAEQRRATLAEIATKRLAAERLEVAAVLAAWDAGIDVPLRVNTNPVALLGVESVVDGPAEPVGFIGKVAHAVLGR